MTVDALRLDDTNGSMSGKSSGAAGRYQSAYACEFGLTCLPGPRALLRAGYLSFKPSTTKPHE